MLALLKTQALGMLLMTHMGLLYEPTLEEPSTIPPTSSATEVVQDTSLKARGRSRHVYNDNNTSTEISYEGTITFTDDEKDIKSISPGGYFKFSKTTFGNRRAIHIESGSNGALKRTYYVGKNEEPYEPEGRKWLADMLPELIASTGIGAEDRVKRIYAKKGTSGVLEAIEEIESDYVKGIYFKYLLAQKGLKDNDLKTIITHVGEELSSDYEKSKLLQQVSGTYLQNSSTATAYITTISDMSSDYEKAKVFSHLFSKTTLSEKQYISAFQVISEEMSSDYEKSKLLQQISRTMPKDKAAVKEAYKRAAKSISSDYEYRKVMTTIE